MKHLFTHILILICFNCYSQESKRESVKISEDENIKITLSYSKHASLSDSDWLKLNIENKSDNAIIIESASYSINKEKVDQNGTCYIDNGAYGSSNKYDLIHQFYDFKNSSSRDIVKINSHNSIEAWKYLTNYTSVLIDGRNLKESNISALFNLKFKYQILNKNHVLHSENIPFNFSWTKSENIPTNKLVERLSEIIYNPHYRWVNSYVTSHLLKIEEVRNSVSTSDLIQGIILRENVMSADENILFLSILKDRNEIPNKEITNSFKKRFEGKMPNVATEFQFYWDDQLLSHILKGKQNHKRYNILELNSEYWTKNKESSKAIYDFLIADTNFSFPKKINKDNFKGWSKDIKTIAIARQPIFEEYLKEFLDDESEYEFEDWSKFSRYGMFPKGAKPEIIKIRTCDIAVVALLRNMNQINFKLSNRIGTRYYSMEIKDELISQVDINKFKRLNMITDIRLTLYEKGIKLTSDLKSKLMKK